MSTLNLQNLQITKLTVLSFSKSFFTGLIVKLFQELTLCSGRRDATASFNTLITLTSYVTMLYNYETEKFVWYHLSCHLIKRNKSCPKGGSNEHWKVIATLTFLFCYYTTYLYCKYASWWFFKNMRDVSNKIKNNFILNLLLFFLSSYNFYERAATLMTTISALCIIDHFAEALKYLLMMFVVSLIIVQNNYRH